MSALEQIRKRPALVISVLGIALLLFIITLAWDNQGGNPFSNPNKMASVDGIEIEYPAFSELISDNDSKQDMAVSQEQAMQYLISKALFDKACEDAGITVSKSEIENILFNSDVNPQAASYLQQYKIIYQPEKAGLSPEELKYVKENQATMQQQWEQGIEQMTEQRLQSKFQYLLTGALTANKLDVKDYAQERNDISDIRIATLAASTLKDDDFKVTDAQIKEKYDAERERWAINQEIRPVTVIRQYIEPSDADLKAATELVAKTKAQLRDTDGITAIAENYAFTSQSISAPLGRLPQNVRDSIARLNADTVIILSGAPRFHHNIAKLLGSKVMSDSLKVDIVAFDKTTVKADSVKSLLASGADLTGAEGIMHQDSIPMTLADPAYAAVRDILSSANLSEYVQASDNSALHQLFQLPATAGLFYRVVERQAPVTVYDVAVIDYRVEPSPKTVEEMTTKLREYSNKNSKADAFRDNAEEAKFYPMEGQVTNTSFAINTQFGPLPDSSKATRWILEADKGQVSDVFNGQEHRQQGDPADYIMVVAVNDIFDGDYIPASAKQVRDYYEPIVLNEMKADKLLEQYKGKATNIDAYATAMNVTATDRSVSLGRNRDIIAGLAANAKKGAIVGPFATDNGIAVFTVTNVNKAPEANYEDMKQSVRQQMFGMLNRQLPAILLGNKRIKGDVAKFISNR